MRTEVVIVGAGPVGLLLAGELRLGGAEVLVLDRLTAATGESRASTLHARTMEILDQRGLLSRFGTPPCEPSGHFGGLRLDLGDVPSPYAGQWKVPQTRTEAVLASWAIGLGTQLRRGHEVVDLTQHPDHVRVRAEGPDGPIDVTARFVVGCDGERGAVSRSAGFRLRGPVEGRELLRADVAGIEVPDRRFQRLPSGMAVAASRADGVTRVMVHEFGAVATDRTAEPSFAEFAATWQRVTGEHIHHGRPLWINAFDDRCAQVTEYRRGRVLLAGDAAHKQLPAGGQALNLGLHDAANLGWKLAAEVRGWAPGELLDSYHRERHPAGARVLANISAQALLLLGGRDVEPLRDVLAELLDLEPVRRTLAGVISGVDVHYDLDDGGPAEVGRRLPPTTVRADGRQRSTASLLRGARGLLLDLSGRIAEPDRDWNSHVRTIRVAPGPDAPAGEFPYLLVRPDGHVAAAGRTVPTGALRRWFGPPEPAMQPLAG